MKHLSVYTAIVPALFLSVRLTYSLIPGDEPAGTPPEGFEDRLLLWTAGDTPEVWFATGPTNCTAVQMGSGHTIASFADGTVLAWGDDTHGQSAVPDGLTNAVAVAAGGYHSLALRADGTVSAWGYNLYGQTNAPVGMTNVVAVAAGEYHSLALLSDGSVVAWGDDRYGQCDIPVTNALAIAAGGLHSLALLQNGSVAAWGYDGDGQTDVPGTVTNAVAVAAGFSHNLALLADGTVVAWGYNGSGQCTVPAGLSGETAVAVGGSFGNGSWAVTENGGLYTWGSLLPPPVTHAASPLYMRFLSAAASELCLTNCAVVRLPSGAATLADSDGDGLSGLDELLLYNTDPGDSDTDGDGLNDGWEITHSLDPLNPADALADPDQDGLATVNEVNTFGTDPFLSDSDGDGLNDGIESLSYALLLDGPLDNYSLAWATPDSGQDPVPALAVGAVKWSRTVLFQGGTAAQWRRLITDTPIIFEGVVTNQKF